MDLEGFSPLKLPISAFIITLNEEENISDCIESLFFCSEIIVIDSGSTDETIRIAKEKGATVIHNEFTGYKDQKQFALNQCSSEWVISLDADERVTRALSNFICTLNLKENPIDGYEVRRLHIFEGKEIRHSGLYPDYKLRFFRRCKGQVVGENIHEVIKLVDGKIERLPYDLLHLSWKDKNDFYKKQLKYAKKVAHNKFLKGQYSSVLDALLKGIFTAFYRYFIRRGFLDGFLGLYISCTMGLITFHKYCELNRLNKLSRNTNKTLFPINSVQRFLLKPIEFVYSLVAKTNLKLYEWNILKSYKTSIPIISIGNLSVGGSGKTPFTIWLAEKLLESGKKVCIISRGYKSSVKGNSVAIVKRDSLSSEVGDEPLLIRQAIDSENLQVIVSPNRYRGVEYGAKELHSEVALLDDGFQHIKLKRDLNICLVDCSDRFAQSLLPLGSLRENFAEIKRADLCVLTRTQTNPLLRDKFLQKIRKISSTLQVYELCESILDFHSFEGKKALLFCGLGNPEQFYEMLRTNGINVIKTITFPDHYNYSTRDLDFIQKIFDEVKAEIIITTRKDAVKIESTNHPINKNLYTANLCVEIKKDIEEIKARLENVFGKYN